MWIVFIIAACIVLIDQISKMIVELNLSVGINHFIIPKFFYITKTYNTGAAWSSFSDNTLFLCLLSLAASVIFIILITKTVKSFSKAKLYSISLGFILGGTVGNLFDRFFTSIGQREGVVDFLGLLFGKYEFPVFNIADSFLVIGVILILIDVLFFMDKRNGSEKNDKKL